MKLLTIILAVLTTLASADVFYMLALRSASPIHFGEINAASGGLYIGKKPAIYCPANTTSCENITSTAYTGPNAYGSLSLDDVVPGGQELYIEPNCGKVEYTIPHSAALPEGAITTGWKLDSLPSYGLVSNDNGGIFFCPENNSTTWRMYVDVEGVEIQSGCLGADLAAGNYTGRVPWEYLG